MSDGLNLAILAGNLGADPELRFTQSGQAVLNLRVATTERYEQKGEWKERTDWHSVVVWGKRAEALAKLLRKGSTVTVQGSIRTSSYESKSGGEKRYKTEVVASQVILTGGRQEEAARDDSHRGAAGGGRQMPEDDIPFISQEPGRWGV